MKNKKAQVMENLGSLAIGVVVLGLMLVISFLVMSNTQDQVILEESAELITVTNETVNWVNNTYVALTYNGRSNLVCNTVYNASDGAGGVISSSLYTCTAGRGIKLTTTNISTNNVTAYVNVTYQYSDGGNAYNSTENLQTATATIPGWVGLIVLVAIGSIILGMITMFGKR